MTTVNLVFLEWFNLAQEVVIGIQSAISKTPSRTIRYRGHKPHSTYVEEWKYYLADLVCYLLAGFILMVALPLLPGLLLVGAAKSAGLPVMLLFTLPVLALGFIILFCLILLYLLFIIGLLILYIAADPITWLLKRFKL